MFEDPTSPLNGENGKQGEDNSAKGFVFWYNLDISKVVQIRYQPDANHADEVAAKGWKHDSFESKIKKGSKGIVEISVELSIKKNINESDVMFLLILMQPLGHATLF